MNEPALDIRDITVGSYVYSRLFAENPKPPVFVVVQLLGEKVMLRSIDGEGAPLYLKATNLYPVRITPEWMYDLDWYDTSVVLGEHVFGYQVEPEDSDEMDYVLRRQDDQWLFTYRGRDIARLEYMHHLQALVWLNEGIWIALPGKEVVAA